MVGIAVGAVAVVGMIGYLAFKKNYELFTRTNRRSN